VELNAVEFAGVSKDFGGRAALRDVSFSLPAGSALGLLGPNGAGKTTALRLILGFTAASAGRLRVRGLPPEDPASRIGVAYLPERLKLPARMSVRGFLKLHGTLAGVPDEELEREVGAVLELTGIADRGHDRIGELSKGLSQRVGFAQAFLGRPELLLLDEPTSGLDPIGVRDARDWIQAARDRGCSVLMSSHILSEVERVCDRVAIVNEGRIAVSGRVDEIVRSGESLEDAFVRVVRGS
jgi:ABC-2 type transport system ATP-binding protein